MALWEVTVLLLCRHHGRVPWESGPLFAITPTPGEISHIARLACWGLKCQSRREVFKLSPLGGRAAAGWRTTANTHRHICKQAHGGMRPRTCAASDDRTRACTQTRTHAHMHTHACKHKTTIFSQNVSNLYPYLFFSTIN